MWFVSHAAILTRPDKRSPYSINERFHLPPTSARRPCRPFFCRDRPPFFVVQRFIFFLFGSERKNGGKWSTYKCLQKPVQWGRGGSNEATKQPLDHIHLRLWFQLIGPVNFSALHLQTLSKLLSTLKLNLKVSDSATICIENNNNSTGFGIKNNLANS